MTPEFFKKLTKIVTVRVLMTLMFLNFLDFLYKVLLGGLIVLSYLGSVQAGLLIVAWFFVSMTPISPSSILQNYAKRKLINPFIK